MRMAPVTGAILLCVLCGLCARLVFSALSACDTLVTVLCEVV